MGEKAAKLYNDLALALSTKDKKIQVVVQYVDMARLEGTLARQCEVVIGPQPTSRTASASGIPRAALVHRFFKPRLWSVSSTRLGEQSVDLT